MQIQSHRPARKFPPFHHFFHFRRAGAMAFRSMAMLRTALLFGAALRARPHPPSSPPPQVLTHEQIDQYARDGVLLVKGLLTPQQLTLAQERAASLLDAKQRRFPNYRLIEFQNWQASASTRRIALDSAAPAMAAQLMGFHEGTPGASPPPPRQVRLLKDIVLAMEAGDTGCGWHVDDKLFWPTFDSEAVGARDEGVNVWITLSDLDARTGSGLAVAVGSHAADFREECRRAIAGAMGGGEGTPRTCELEELRPDCHQQMEALKQLHTMDAGDALFSSRYLFHRGEPFAQGEAKLRLVLRYVPADSRFFDVSVFRSAAHGGYNASNQTTVEGLKHGDRISEAGASFPQVWPVVGAVEGTLTETMNEAPSPFPDGFDADAKSCEAPR